MLGLYVHIPFCAKKCPYCDFYSLANVQELQEPYAAAVLAQMERMEDGVVADTLYFGGGTPVLMKPALLGSVVQKAKEKFSLSGEITLEANPCSVSLDRLRALFAYGFNRISFGMQSAVEAELKLLGRRHSAEQVREAVRWAKQAGFTNISVDIMLGTPGQTIESLDQTLDFLGELNIQHISAYLLKIEPGTAFDCAELRALVPDEDLASDSYLHVCRRLEAMGFPQYEISNFAQTGFESQHNLKYWRAEEYRGFGPSAHSFWNGQRLSFPRDLQAYLDTQGKNGQIEQAEVNALEEYLMLRLRLTEGIRLEVLQERFQLSPELLLQKAKRYLPLGLMKQEGDRLYLTPEGFLISNLIIGDFVELA